MKNNNQKICLSCAYLKKRADYYVCDKEFEVFEDGEMMVGRCDSYVKKSNN